MRERNRDRRALALLVEDVRFGRQLLRTFVITGKPTSIYTKLPRNLDLTVKHVVKTASFFQIV